MSLYAVYNIFLSSSPSHEKSAPGKLASFRVIEACIKYAMLCYAKKRKEKKRKMDKHFRLLTTTLTHDVMKLSIDKYVSSICIVLYCIVA